MFLLPESSYEVVTTKSKGRGVFAKKDISPGVVVGDYIGTLLYDEDVPETDGIYDLTWGDGISIVANPKSLGVHFINHSCAPNCAMFPYQGHTLFITLRKIFVGEELSIGYMLSVPDDDEEEHIMESCRCGSLVCRGTFYVPESYHERYADFEEKMSGSFFEKNLVKIGQQVPPLLEYPENIDDYDIYDIFGSMKQLSLTDFSYRVPEKKHLRQLIRNSGQRIKFKNIGLTIYGIMNDSILGIWE